ncbi:UNVERIFIED_CONTAM: hypothetical protein Sindi_2886600 [Sesamum indicum]
MVLAGEASTSAAKAKGPHAGGGRRVRQNQLLQVLRVLLFPNWAWEKGKKRRFSNHGFQKMFALIAMKRGHRRESVHPVVKLISTKRRAGGDKE